MYKASRRREYERVKAMDEEVEREEADAKFEIEREEKRRRDEERTEKNRRRRNKKKGGGKKEGEGGGEVIKGVKKGPVLRVRRIGEIGWGDEDEGEEVQGKTVEEKGVVIHDDD